jgi:hypothetical protein
MKNVLGTVTVLDDAFLDSMRQAGDPDADAVAHDLCERGSHRIVAQLIREGRVWDETGAPSPLLPEPVRHYLLSSRTLPPWQDPAKIRRAEEFFLLYGLASSTLLACASLPECYVMKYGAEVLAFTKFLQVDPTRRIRETAQMVMDVMSTGGLTSQGGRIRGVETTQKVRVMHAIIRHMVEHAPGSQANPIDPELRAKFGKPINQEDMAYTLMTFSYVVIRGFATMGLRMTDDEKDAYVHCWNVVGYLMGIREELLPATFEDSRELFTTIQRRQHGASQAGQNLTRALLGVLERPMPPAFRRLPAVMTRDLVGDETADALGVPRAPLLNRAMLWTALKAWAGIAMVLSRLYVKRPYRLASEFIHRRLMLAIGQLPGGGFNFPPEFVNQWFPGETLKAE